MEGGKEMSNVDADFITPSGRVFNVRRENGSCRNLREGRGGGVKRNIERESASRAPDRWLSLQTGKQIGVINGQRYIARDLNQLLQRHAIYLKIPDAECGSRLGAVCARGGGLRQQRTEERKLVGEHHALRTTMEGGVAAAHGLKSPHPPHGNGKRHSLLMEISFLKNRLDTRIFLRRVRTCHRLAYLYTARVFFFKFILRTKTHFSSLTLRDLYHFRWLAC